MPFQLLAAGGALAAYIAVLLDEEQSKLRERTSRAPISGGSPFAQFSSRESKEALLKELGLGTQEEWKGVKLALDAAFDDTENQWAHVGPVDAGAQSLPKHSKWFAAHSDARLQACRGRAETLKHRFDSVFSELDVVRFCRAEVAYDFAMSHAWTIALGRYAKPTGIVEAEVLVYDPWLKYIPPFAVYPIRKIPLTDFP